MELLEESRELCQLGLRGLFSLWNHSVDDMTAFRTSMPQAAAFYPTATLHWAIALSETGALSEERRYSRNTLHVFGLEVSGLQSPPPSRKGILDRLVSLGVDGKSARWVDALLLSSSHTASATGKAPKVRQLIPLGHLSDLLHSLLVKHRDTQSKATPAIQNGLRSIIEKTLVVFSREDTYPETKKLRPSSIMSAVAMMDDCYLSPYLALHAASVVAKAAPLLTRDVARDKLVEALRDNLAKYFELEVYRSAARRGGSLDPQFDPVSLVFALRGWDLLEPSARTTPFFRSCLGVVVSAQHDDGCWSDGISVSFDETGDSTQQQSIDVCLSLAEIVFQPTLLQHCDVHSKSLAQEVRPAIERTIRYLRASLRWVEQGSEDGLIRIPGWVSDRVRAPGVIETWTTALATRVSMLAALIERVIERAQILDQFPTTKSPPIEGPWGPRDDNVSPILSRWDKAMVRSDLPQDPVLVIQEDLLTPIESQWKRGLFTLLPTERLVSFLVFGPPGSGKTYFVSQVADALGWPLISLNPGHFISDGLDAIESTASAVFRQICVLEHVVVFFDECDELFRDRDDVSGTHRSILSFVTACMLTKLQKLHDVRRVVYFAATNYLRRIDLAVRRPGRFDRILLLDRPDKMATMELMRRRIMEVQEKDQVPDTLEKKLPSIVDSIAGLTAQEIRRVGRELAKKKKLTTSFLDDFRHSKADYVEWCVKNGAAEIDAAKVYQDEEKSRIVESWSRVENFDAQNKRLKGKWPVAYPH